MVQTQKVLPLQLGDTLSEVVIDNNKTFIYYQLNIGDDYAVGQDVIIKAIPLDYNSDPDIYISTKNQYPSNKSNSEWICGAYGKDTCSIYHKNITQGTPFFIGVYCMMGHCRFQLKVIMSEEFLLDNGVEFQFYLESQAAKVFYFQIPPESEMLEGDQNGIVGLKNLAEQAIIIKASAYRSDAHDFNLMATIACLSEDEEDVLPSTNFESKKGVSAWKKGQVIRIGIEEFPKEKWDGCIIELVMDVVDSGEYHIMVSTNDAVPQLYNQQQIDDIVKFDRIQCYKYYVKEEHTDFQIYLTTYSGRVDIGVNPGEQNATSFDNFSIMRKDEHESIIDVRGGMRRHSLDQITGIYYICVKGVVTSTYSMKVREFQEERGHHTAEDGFAEQFMLRKSHSNAHIYKVPKLEYAKEDITIQISLIVKRGGGIDGTNGSLSLAARLCTEQSTDDCRINSKNEVNNNDYSQLSKGQDNGSGVYLTLDHNETQCAKDFNGECYYVILVNGASENQEYSVYELLVSHSQNNHIIIKENQPQIDQVDQLTFKYFKFQMPAEDSEITGVVFNILPIHGDSDIYVSRTNKFPNRTSYDKRSMKVGSTEDRVEYSTSDKPVVPLSGTYYIGVYGYTYASYGLLAQIKRVNATKAENLKSKTVRLYENIPMQMSLHNELDMFFGYFEVDMEEGDEREIEIHVQNIEEKTHTLISFGKLPMIDKHDYDVIEGSVFIVPGDKRFHRQGVYYVTVMPYFGFGELFEDNYYKFQLTWKMESQFTYLTANSPQQITIKHNKYAYFKHYLMDSESDLRVSILSGGHQDLFISARPDLQYPDIDDYDLTTKFQTGSNYTSGKSLYISGVLLGQLNPSCADLGYAETDPCVIYIGVLCKESSQCKSKIELEYENNTPKKLVIGQTKHATMDANSMTYYYITVSQQSQVQDIYAVLSPLVGDVDLYASIKSSNEDPSAWELPTVDKHDFQSTSKLKTEVIHIARSQLDGCFIERTSFTNVYTDCVIIFGVHSLNGGKYNEQVFFNFVVYKNVLELHNNIPATGYAKAGEFTYFIYKSVCSNCSILIGLSSYFNGDPDIYVIRAENNGTRLPSLTDYDFKKSTMNSEILTLNLDAVPANNKPRYESMEGLYIIGVYGSNNSTFQLSISDSQHNGDNAFTTLTDGMPIKNTQDASTYMYYQFYNWNHQDLEITLSVPSGSASIYVNTYHQDDNLTAQLPQCSNMSTWSVEQITTMNQVEHGKELVILNQDRNYCSDCMYIIGVYTQSHTQYSLVVHSIDAEKNYTHLMKIGESKMLKFQNVGDSEVFQFMIESKDSFTILPTIISGDVQIYLSLDELKENAIMSTKFTSMTVSGSQLKTETNYYIIVECLSPKSEISLTIFQKSTVVTIHDGIPQLLYYSDDQDISKYITFTLSPGNQTVMISVKSRTKNFYPVLYTYIYEKPEPSYTNQAQPSTAKSTPSIVFPPSEQISYSFYGASEGEWDKELYMLKHTIQLIDLPQNIGGIAINLMYHMDKPNPNDTQTTFSDAMAAITITHSQMLKAIPDMEYYGELPRSNSFTMFAVDPPAGKNVFLTYSACLGFIFVSLVDPANPENKTKIDFTEEQGMNHATIRRNQSSLFYIMVEPLNFGYIIDHEKREYLIKMHYMSDDEHMMHSTFISKEGGYIKYEYLPHKRDRSVRFSWGALYEMRPYQQMEHRVQNVRYQMVYSFSPNARLDTVCAIKRRSDVFKVIGNVQDATSHVVNTLEPGKEIYFNIIAMQDDQQIAVPYKPVTIYIPRQDAREIPRLLFMLLLIIVVLVFASVYFWIRSRRLNKQLSEEVREIVSAGNNGKSSSIGGDAVSKYGRLGGPAEGGKSKKKVGYGEMADEMEDTQ